MERIKNFLFINTNTKQTVIKNTLWLFIGEFGVRILKLFLFAFAARKLGASEWGTFSYALALMGMFAVISDIGINTVILRETAKKSDNINEYISTGFFLKIGLSVISSMALLAMLLFLKSDNGVRVLIPITCLILFFDSIREFGFAINRAFEKMEIEAFVKLVTTVILIFFGIILIIKEGKAISLSYAYLISSITGIIIMYFSLRNHFKKIVSNVNKKLFYFIFKEAWPIATVGVIGTIMSNIDMVILGWYTNNYQIGIYSAAQKPVQVIYLIPSLLGTAIFPVFSRLVLSEKENIKKFVNKTIYFSFLFSITASVGVLIIGGPIFNIMFGNQYAASIPLFKIMSLAIVTGAPGMILSNIMYALGKQKEIIRFILITLCLNIILCMILIPRYNIYGAAISVTLSQTIGNILLLIRSRKYV